MKDCTDGDLERAEQACIHYNWPIRIKAIVHSINQDDVDDSQYPDLNIDFCGIKCENPFFLRIDRKTIINLKRVYKINSKRRQCTLKAEDGSELILDISKSGTETLLNNI